ncbi:MAG TPA: tetratricopeptide repeat protein [Syntrophales bacterium]|nr:tetratricopeptide repeat protein [Syntrophales bacterium]
METRRHRMCLIGLLVLILLAGCIVSESYKTGQDLGKQNRWDEAIGYFETALKESPDNQEYKDTLLKAKQEAAKVHYEKAKSQLAQSQESIPALEQISKESSLAYNLDPTNKTIKSFNDNLKEKIESLNNQVKLLYGQSETDMQREAWLTALAKLKQVNRLFPGYEDTGARITKIEQEGARLFYQQGVSLSRQEEWKSAAQAFKAVIDINPAYYDAEKLYQDALSKDNGDYYVGAGDRATREQNWDKAISMYEKALSYKPEDQPLATKLGVLKEKVGRIYFEEGVRLSDQGRLYAAMKKSELIKAYTPSLQGDAAYRNFTGKLCARLMDRAEKYAGKELWGNALVWYQKAEGINANYQDLFQKILETKDYINKRIKKSIAVFDFGSPSNNKDAGKIAANKLITYLHKNASGDLRIIERENLQSILREMQLGQTGIVDVKSVQTAKMRGIDTFIMGDVLNFSSKTTDNPSTSQVKVLVDEEDVRNPEFSDWLIMHPRPMEEDLKTAPPRTIKKKNYQFVSYRQGVTRISAMIEVSYKLVDTATGENIFTNTVSGKMLKEGTYQDAVPAANIPHKALELPTEPEVLDDLTNEKISEMGKSVLKHYQSLEVEYFNQGEQQRLKRRNDDLAIEKYTDAIFDEKSKGIFTPISQKSTELIESLLQGR